MTQSKRPRPCVQPPLANTIPPTAAVRPLLYLNGAPVLASGSRCGRTVTMLDILQARPTTGTQTILVSDAVGDVHFLRLELAETAVNRRMS